MRKSAPQQRLLAARCAGLLTAAAFLLANADDPQVATPLTASSKWGVDYAEQCTLLRTFNSEAGELTLAIVSAPGRRIADFLVIERNATSGSKRAVLKLEASTTVIEASMPATRTTPADGTMTRGSVVRSELTGLEATQSVTLTVNDRVFKLPLAGFKSALEALNRCEAELARRWGIDSQALARIKTPPEPEGSPAKWITHNDYPSGAFQRREGGEVGARLDIDAAGNVLNCAVVQSSGSKELDGATCSLVKRRARFKPARDEAGMAVPSLWYSRFAWMIQ